MRFLAGVLVGRGKFRFVSSRISGTAVALGPVLVHVAAILLSGSGLPGFAVLAFPCLHVGGGASRGVWRCLLRAWVLGPSVWPRLSPRRCVAPGR